MKRVHRDSGFADEAFFEAMQRGLIEVDDKGQIWKLARQQFNPWTREMKLVLIARKRFDYPTKSGYRRVSLKLDGEQYATGAHRVVWRCLKGPIPAKLTVNYDDGKKNNNVPSNLELATNSEQSKHAVHKLGWKSYKNMLGKNSQPGIRNGMAKLSTRTVRAIRSAKQVRGVGRRLARKYGIGPATVHRIRHNQAWTHL